MPATFIHDGSSIDYTPGSNLSVGDVVVQGSLVGVAKTDIAANTLGALAIDGVFDFPKAAGEGLTFAAGALVYWDVADGEATDDADSGTNKLIGKAVGAAADGDSSVRVRMSQ
jgi:predicted RecA/RadA family phage recombinase